MDLGLNDSVALVAGGTGLIGRAVAALLHAEGATVVLAARDEMRLAETAEAVGPGVDTVVLDTTDQDSVDLAVQHVLDLHGCIDVLVNTAAPPATSIDPARSAEPEVVAEAFGAKAMGYLRLTNAVLVAMRAAGHGRVVQVGGMHAYMSASVAAATRNAAVVTATKCLADELAGSGITLNVVHPGPVTEEPPGQPQVAMNGDSSPEQVAALIVFLASTQAAAISGESVSVGHRLRGLMAW